MGGGGGVCGDPERQRRGAERKKLKARCGKEKVSPVTDAMERRGKMKTEKTWEDLAINGLLLTIHSLLREVVLGEKC